MSTRDDGKKKGPAWLGKRQAAGKAQTARDWTKHQSRGSSDAYQYKLKRTLLWLGCLVLFAAFIFYLIPPKNTPLVILRASRYPLQMPPLALAAEDEYFLQHVSPSNLPLRQSALFRYLGSSDNQTDEEGTPQRFLAQLKTVKPSGPGWFSRNDAVVIYISAHGLVNEDGQACLVPPNADAFNTSRWLPLVKFLKDVCALPNLKRARKLVILDCNRISMKWRSGVLDNRFADQLPSVVDQVDDPNLYVLNSTSPGQVAWAAPEMRGSVFGHFVGLGLRGDASSEYAKDLSRGTVSLLELHAYLTARVDDYVQQRRGVRQTPLLIGGADGLPVTRDVPIVSADLWRSLRGHELKKSSYDVLAKAKELIEPAGDKPSPLQLAWRAYQQRSSGEGLPETLPLPWRRGFVQDPVRWSSLEQRLLALEDRLFAGEEYQEGLGNQFAALNEELAAGNWQEFPETQSATNLRLKTWQQIASLAKNAITDDSTTHYDELYNRWLKAMPEEQAKITVPAADRPRALVELLAQFGLNDKRVEAGEKFDRERLNSVLRFLQLTGNKAAPSADLLPIEGQFLKLLNGNTTAAAERMLPEMIRSRSLAEQAATPLDVRIHYALEKLINQADSERRAAEDAFFLGDQVSLDGTGTAETNEAAVQKSAEQRLIRANGGAAAGYLAARKWGEQLEHMHLLRDEIWSTLPHFAEWYFRRWRLELNNGGSSAEAEYQAHIATLSEVLDDNIRFAEQIDRVVNLRDNNTELRDALKDTNDTFLALQQKWQALRRLVTVDAEALGNAEIRFQTAATVRQIEQIMQSPLVSESRVKGMLSKYHNTLAEWAKQELPKPKTLSTAAASPKTETPFLTGYRDFLVRYHKVLTHEFRLPYEQHRETLKLEQEDTFVIDQRVRQEKGAKDRTLWQTLQNVLADYDVAIQGKPISVGPTTPAVRARQELVIWDQRVRASAFWLGGFNQNLVPDPIGIPTPTAWLREVDHWHLSCWHGYRALQDFWGNGLPYDRSEQYFDTAVQQCAKAATAKQLPWQYDLPGGDIENLASLRTARVTAHQAGLDLEVPNVQIPESAATLPFVVKTRQRIESADHQPANFPAGDAGFFLSRAGALEPLDETLITYGDNKSLARFPVQLTERLRQQPDSRSIACAIAAAKLDKPPVSLEGRVWYRGHIWSQPFELYHSAPAKGIRFVHRREPYSAPTVQVGGDDAPSGAVMFVFDCSSSMMSGDGRFNAAKQALQEILKDLKTAPAGGLQVGLIAYGHRTAHRAGYFPAPNNLMYYKADKLWDDGDNLTADGIAAAKKDPKFASKFPHPDRDIEVLLKPGLGWAGAIDPQLDSLDVNRCFGVTPLYASITQAIQEVNAVRGVESRQVIVLSDGVNIPNNCDLSLDKILVKGLQQNNEDLDDLTKLVKNSPKVNVRIVLFGGVKPGLEKAQLGALEGVGDKPQFVVDAVPSPKAIKKAIAAAFAKPDFEIVSADPDQKKVGRQAFNDTWTYPNWPTAGDRIAPRQHQVMVRGPRLSDPLTQLIRLSGGEALRLEYDASAASLLFVPDLLDAFDTDELAAVGNITPPARPIVAEAVKPLVGSQAGETRPTTFRVRLRSKANSEFVAWPRYVWAEIRPRNSDPKSKDLVFQIADVKFDDKTRTPILQFPVPGWPIAVEGATIDLWVRYGAPPPLFPTVTIGAADAQLPAIAGSKFGLNGVDFVIRQQMVEGTLRKVTITEKHPNDTPLAKLYRTRVQLSPPAEMVERMYVSASSSSPTSEVIHTFHYTSPTQLSADLSLEVNSAEQLKDGSLKASLDISNWNR